MFKQILAVAALAASLTAQAANPQVEVRTNMGTMVLELYPDKAPETVKNFLGYVKSGFYDGTVFHRVIDGFMIQGGGFDLSLRQKETGKPVRNEAANGLRNDKFTVAMARTSEPHSATAQFFINVADNAFLNYRSPDERGYGYAVFGRVVKGQDVAAKIAKSETTAFGPFSSDVPVTAVVMERVGVLPAK